ncbi:WD repeat-containing protein 18 [Histomonas meleagridis]|uniref:WD repeat-containing protein 18 n=1 Tax=Histomonas meleagridis TaxID=135588 RepID=UPI003559AEAC|nr:WD repeat-containing protein 18 [Histomonas meleagridis]KAH0798519.1 WD repeat-containing protein 18 [Histomonas meleagridis]
MNLAKTILVSCSKNEQSDSFAIRNDNLATVKIFEGSTTLPSKHFTTISEPFILTVDMDRTKRLSSAHATGLIPKGECIIQNDAECIYAADNYLAVGSSDGTLRIWNTNDGELVIEQQLHLGPLTVIYIDTTLWLLFASSTTGRIGAFSIPELYTSAEADQIWNVHSLKITDFVVSSGTRVYTVSLDKTAKCYDYCSSCEIFSVNLPTPITCCTLSHNESILYCGGSDGCIYQIEVAQDGLQAQFEGHTMEITDLLISDDDRSLYSISLDSTVRRWDTSTGQTINHIDTKGVPFALRFIPIIEVQDRQNSEGRKVKLSKKKAIERREQMKKGFPKLQRQISGNKNDLVSAPIEDMPILTVEEETQIAIADICNTKGTFDVIKVEETQEINEREEKNEMIKPPLHDDENEEIRRQNALMFQYIMSKQTN